MSTPDPERLRSIKTFASLVKYLCDELDWPIDSEDFDDLTFDYQPEELGLDAKTAVKIREIKQLRPLVTNQPWGIFFLNFEPKRLPVVVLRRILRALVFKKRQSANRAHQATWQLNDLLFISSYGEAEHRDITFAHFSEEPTTGDLPSLKVLGWDDEDTVLHLAHAHKTLEQKLRWPGEPADLESWRSTWSAAFTLRHREVITTSKALAVHLAELATAIRKRVNRVLAVESDKGPLRKLHAAFKEALIHDLTEDDFSDMYAQTITYGLLSARVSRPAGLIAENVADMVPVTNPFLRDMLSTFLTVGGRKGKVDFDELGINDVVQALRDANMGAVLRDFGDKNPQEDPVVHFYELFLKEYDPRKRMQRGVFYTPRPVVFFIVRSVDEILRTEFGLADGLADITTWGEMVRRHPGMTLPEGAKSDQPFVQILDPACGTGTFLVEVIATIHRTMSAKWRKQGHMALEIPNLWNEYVSDHVLPRLYGFELMMAPYAVAHMKIGLKLHETGYDFRSHERARIYLTNTLEEPKDFSDRFEFDAPALAHEAHAVNVVKKSSRFTVVLGNPPYSGHSLNNQVKWIVDKVYDYKRGYPDLQKPGQAKWLQDDYVKFLRFAEWQVERSGRGVIGFITNHAWLDNPTFKGMRQHFLNSFERLAVLDLHGNANKKELAPDGSPDKNVFEIKQGVAVSLLRRPPLGRREDAASIDRSDLLGTDTHKYAVLMASNVDQLPSARFQPLPPELIFANLDDARKQEYDVFVALPIIMDQNGDPAPGIVTTHDEFAISFSRQEQIEKVEALLATRTEAEGRKLFTLCSQNQWIYDDAKKALRTADWKKDLVPILYRPFDTRWTVYSRYVAVHRRERVSMHFLTPGNVGLITSRQRSQQTGEWAQVFATSSLIESCAISNKTKEINYVLPLWLEPEWPGTRRLANLSSGALRVVRQVTGLAPLEKPEEPVSAQRPSDRWNGRGDLHTTFGPRDLFDFTYAVLHSNSYRARYADFLKSDFARIPLAPTQELFRDLARLGGELVALHLMESPKPDRFITTYTGPKNPEVGRVGWSDDAVWLDAAPTKKGHPVKAGTIGFYGVPEAVWNFHIGGYQVCEKWLKDRKGRTLSKDDVAHYQKIVVALAETIRLMKEIDEVIEQHGGWPNAFVTGREAKTGASR